MANLFPHRSLSLQEWRVVPQVFFQLLRAAYLVHWVPSRYWLPPTLVPHPELIDDGSLQHKRSILAAPKRFFTTTTRRHDVLLRTTRRKRRVFEAQSAKNVVSSCRRGEKNKQRSCTKALNLAPIDLVPDTAQIQQAERIALLIEGAARRLPWRSTCLIKALAGWQLLRQHGLNPHIQLGVQQHAETGLGAHAWLVLGDKNILGGKEAPGFSTIITPRNQF